MWCYELKERLESSQFILNFVLSWNGINFNDSTQQQRITFHLFKPKEGLYCTIAVFYLCRVAVDFVRWPQNKITYITPQDHNLTIQDIFL
jgi:magnesium-transporting ATPase (P-type)